MMTRPPTWDSGELVKTSRDSWLSPGFGDTWTGGVQSQGSCHSCVTLGSHCRLQVSLLVCNMETVAAPSSLGPFRRFQAGPCNNTQKCVPGRRRQGLLRGAWVHS